MENKTKLGLIGLIGTALIAGTAGLSACEPKPVKDNSNQPIRYQTGEKYSFPDGRVYAKPFKNPEPLDVSGWRASPRTCTPAFEPAPMIGLFGYEVWEERTKENRCVILAHSDEFLQVIPRNREKFKGQESLSNMFKPLSETDYSKSFTINSAQYEIWVIRGENKDKEAVPLNSFYDKDSKFILVKEKNTKEKF